MPNYTTTRETTINFSWFLGLFLIYLGLRVLAWQNAPLLEDHDSVAYLSEIKVFLTFDLHQIINLSPDSAPFYPFFGALWSSSVGSVETGARLCSLVFSCLLFIAIIGIGKRIATLLEVGIGLVILALSPALIRLSYSVLTEPSYIAVVYLGFWLFLTQHNYPRLWSAALLGILFGLSFLNRIEGVLYLAGIPLLQLAHFFAAKHRSYDFRRLSVWTALFILSFSLISAPQVWRVSEKVGSLSLNGRQAWSLILNNPDGKPYSQKIYGLDYSPGQINLHYLQEHRDELQKLVSDAGPMQTMVSYTKRVAVNLDRLNQEKLGQLIGPFGMIFFAFGLLALYKSGYRFETFLIVAFTCIGLVAPLLHDVDLRHIAVIAPLMMLVEGIGIVYVARALSGFIEIRFINARSLSGALLVAFIILSANSINVLMRHPDKSNSEYRPNDLKEPVTIVKQITSRDLGRPAVIAARKGYLAYFTNSKRVPIPYTDYQGLVKFCALNGADLVFLEHGRLSKYPFLRGFSADMPTPEFDLLYSGFDSQSQTLELYRFRK